MRIFPFLLAVLGILNSSFSSVEILFCVHLRSHYKVQTVKEFTKEQIKTKATLENMKVLKIADMIYTRKKGECLP